MEKWIMCILVGVLMAGSASAAGGALGSDEKSEEQLAMERSHRTRQGGQQRRSQMSEEKRVEMKAHREQTRKMVEDARAETDPAKKNELVEQLRTRLTEGAKKMQAEFRKRLDAAEQGVEKMKVRLAEGDENMKQRVDERLQKLLAGEKPERPQGRRIGKRGPLSTSE